MRWGVRRYQNPDGSLTPEGKKRYARDISDNLSKKKDNRIDTSEPNARRWVKEDTERRKKTVDTTSSMVKEMKNIEQHTRRQSATSKTKLDLSQMSDKELRERINRELLERQYSNLFAEESQPPVSKGRERVVSTLDFAGDVLAVGSSALAIALAVRELRG